jgi:small-conductance mechanosensitive channel
MDELLKSFNSLNLMTTENMFKLLAIGLTIVIGFPLIKLVSVVTMRLTRKRLTEQTRMLIRKGIFYLGSLIILINVFTSLGVNLTALFGAAGIAGIALGFASQTSLSNLISGLFLIAEKPFAVDDVIRVGTTTGTIISIDLLSVKIRTFDNAYIRIPNEKLLNTEVVNLTRFPIRRLDITLTVAYKEDLRKVHKVLAGVAHSNVYCLDEPEELIMVNSFADSGVEMLFGVWFEKNDAVAVKNTVMSDIRDAFAREGIEIPYPHIRILPDAAGAADTGLKKAGRRQ